MIVNVFMLAALTCSLPGTSAAQGITLKEYFESTGREREVYRVYLRGVEVGFSWYGGTYRQIGSLSIYCLPTEKVLSVAEMEKMVSIYIDKKEFSDSAIAALLLKRLSEVFPCTISGQRRR
jgi:hypothetical protein